MTPDDARAEIVRAEAAYDAVPPDAPRQVRQEARLAWELAIRRWHLANAVERQRGEEQHEASMG